MDYSGSVDSYSKLYHISEQPGLILFEPRPSPSYFESIKGDVVFAITGRLLHNYLLPRDCPRICYYATANTVDADRETFFSGRTPEFVMLVESSWYERVKNTILYCYEFPADGFVSLDEVAGYYISYEAVKPIGETLIDKPLDELLKRNIELRFIPNLIDMAKAVSRSTLNFSLIRMRNAQQLCMKKPPPLNESGFGLT